MKIMKKLFIAAIMTFFALGVSAQSLRPINFGVKTGVITGNIDILKGGKNGINNLFSDSKVGWQIGMTSRINLAMFHIQPEVLFNMNRYELKAEDMSGGSWSSADVKINTVDVPVLFGLKLLIIRMQAGPTFNLMTDVKVKNNTGAKHYVNAERASIAYTLGLGLDLWGVNFDVRHNGNFKKMRQDIQIGENPTTTYKTTFNSWMFSLGYMF